MLRVSSRLEVEMDGRGWRKVERRRREGGREGGRGR